MSAKYVLPRDSTEAQRLDMQHDVWTKNLNYLLHPAVQAIIKPTSRIADIACGTGRFLRQLAKEIPTTCQLDGFDISSNLFPTDDTVPSNITLSVHDGLQPFPTHLHSKYDVVHLRLLVAALDEPDWAVMVTHSLALLTPGGAIQWDEGDMEHLKYYRGGPTGTIDSGLALQACQAHLMRHRWLAGWRALPGIFEAKGLRVVRDMVSTDRDVSSRTDGTKASIVLILGMARSLAEKGVVGPLGDLKSIDEFERRIYEEAREGLYMRYDIYVFVGLKSEMDRI